MFGISFHILDPIAAVHVPIDKRNHTARYDQILLTRFRSNGITKRNCKITTIMRKHRYSIFISFVFDTHLIGAWKALFAIAQFELKDGGCIM